MSARLKVKCVDASRLAQKQQTLAMVRALIGIQHARRRQQWFLYFSVVLLTLCLAATVLATGAR